MKRLRILGSMAAACRTADQMGYSRSLNGQRKLKKQVSLAIVHMRIANKTAAVEVR